LDVAEIEDLLTGVGNELRHDLLKAAATDSGDAGFAENGEMFRGETGLATDCLGDLCYHERFSGSAKFLQDSPPCFVTNGKKHLIKT